MKGSSVAGGPFVLIAVAQETRLTTYGLGVKGGAQTEEISSVAAPVVTKQKGAKWIGGSGSGNKTGGLPTESTLSSCG